MGVCKHILVFSLAQAEQYVCFADMFLLNEQLIVPSLYADMTGWVEMHKYWKGGDLTRVGSSGRARDTVG